LNNEFIVFLPNIILLVLFIIFLWQRHSLRYFDWATLICVTLGIFLLAIVILLILDNQSEAGPVRGFLIAVPAVIFILFLLFLYRIFTVEKMKTRLRFDERITIINAKSARNGLVAVFLSSVIYLLIYANISRVMLLAILAVSLVVYLASMIIYYYRSF
jgi:hypothetical protein